MDWRISGGRKRRWGRAIVVDDCVCGRGEWLGYDVEKWRRERKMWGTVKWKISLTVKKKLLTKERIWDFV